MNRRRVVWWTATAGLLLLGVALLGGARLATVRQSGAPVAGESQLAQPPRAAAGVGRSAPVRLEIADIGVDTALDSVGMAGDGTVEQPPGFARAAWYRPGPTPGQQGSAVILGHVDSYRGPAVFLRLGQLRAGEDIHVTRADGSLAHFLVDRVRTVPKDHFPAQEVYGDHGDTELQLVTCGGQFDTTARSYLSNVIVNSVLTGVDPPVSRSS